MLSTGRSAQFEYMFFVLFYSSRKNWGVIRVSKRMEKYEQESR